MKWVGEACPMIGQLQNVISQSEPRELKMIAIKCFFIGGQSNCKQTAAVNHAYHSELRFLNSLLKMIQKNIIPNISIGPNFEQIVPHNSIYNNKKKKICIFLFIFIVLPFIFHFCQCDTFFENDRKKNIMLQLL